MNPSIPEEVGSTARGIVEGLKAQPAVLALSLAQIMMLVFLFYALSASAEFRDKMFSQVVDNSTKIHDILATRQIACPPTAPP
jgi:hypothetical protein